MKKILFLLFLFNISSSFSTDIYYEFPLDSTEDPLPEAEAKEQKRYHTFEELLSNATVEDKKTLLDIILKDAETIRTVTPLEWRKINSERMRKIKALGFYGKKIADVIYNYQNEDLAASQPSVYIFGLLQPFFKVIFDSLPEREKNFNLQTKRAVFNKIVSTAMESEKRAFDLQYEYPDENIEE